MTEQQNGTPSGPRYQLDRFAQRIGPLRAADAWGLKHPVANALSFVLTAVFIAVVASLAWHSWIEGCLAGIGIALLSVVTTRANHRRRVRNGTSAEYGPPQKSSGR
jgi:hypothetical protein